MARIAVHGSATRTLAPERGTVHLSVTVSGDSRADVLGDARRTHAEVVAQARRFVDAGAATRWTSPDVHVWAYTDWVPAPGASGAERQEQVTRYRAGAEVQVRFATLDEVGDWTASVAALDGVDVQRIVWDLTAATREAVLREVRAEACLDAVGRARDYAAALDLGDARLVALYEDGLHPGAAGSDGGAPRILAKAAALDAAGFDLRPHDIEVTAAVTAELDTER
jgi:uncharacterized protein YggE